MNLRIDNVRNTLVAGLLLAFAVVAATAEAQPAAARQESTRTKELARTAPVNGRSVAVSGSGMTLQVRPGAGDQATVEAVLEYWSNNDDWMEHVAATYDVRLRETSGRVTFEFGPVPESERGGLLRRILGSDSTSWSLDVTLTVPEGTELVVNNSYGPVDVAGVGGSVRIVNSSGSVHVDGSRDTRIENSYAEVEVSDVTGTVHIDATSAAVSVIDVEGTVEATTSYSPLKVHDVRGDVTASAGSGSLDIRRVEGSVRSRNTYAPALIEDIEGEVDHETASGQVEIRRVGGRVRAEGSYGDMEVSETGDVDLRNGSGAVTVRSIRGDARISNSYAPVEALDIEGELVVDSSSASVRVENVGGAVTVTTSYDGVAIDGVGGAVTVRNGSGRIVVSGFRGAALAARHQLETTYAGIEVVWPRGAAVAVDAESTYGGIASDVGGTVETSGSGARQRLTREADGGGRLRLVSSNGAIRIRQQ